MSRQRKEIHDQAVAKQRYQISASSTGRHGTDKRAIRLDPRFTGAYLNLADAELHHVPGLLLVHRHDNDGVRKTLVEAAKLAPDNARYTSVQVIALHAVGQPARPPRCCRIIPI